MPVVNIGLGRTRDRVIDINSAAKVDSIGIGTDTAADSAASTKLAEAGGANNSYWKSGGSLTTTSNASGSGQADPYWQFEATWATGEANDANPIREIGTSAGTLTGTNPAGNDGTNLYSRKKIGGTAGIGKTSDIELVGRVKVTY